MAKIKVQDLTSIIQDLSEHELNSRGGCGISRTIKVGNFVITLRDMCFRLPPNFSPRNYL